MARIKQVGVGRKTNGTIDGITYVTRKGVTYARSTPNMPASAYKTPGALKRQAIFRMVQMHMKYHLRSIKQTFTPKGAGTSANQYYSKNGKSLTKALDALADRWVAGEIVTISDVEQAICTYASENPNTILIASLNGYKDEYLAGEWPSTITLQANDIAGTVVINLSDNGGGN